MVIVIVPFVSAIVNWGKGGREEGRSSLFEFSKQICPLLLLINYVIIKKLPYLIFESDYSFKPALLRLIRKYNV